MRSFGDRLRRLRQQSGLSQEALAQRAGLSTEAISLLERGRRTPRITTMRLLADALSLTEADRADLFASLAPPERPHRPLPNPADPLIGRDAELAALERLLAHPAVRLVTLSGAGGVGKTRLAVAAARRQADRFADGVRWLPLGTLTHSTSLTAAVAAALGATPGREHLPESLAEHLAGTQALLVFDNAEHVLAELGELCTAILAAAGEVKILLTSRHQLRIPGENVFALRPLDLPASASPADLTRSAASRLFLQRAGRHDLESLSPLEAAAVVRICQRLDGLPLALELAAARTGVLTVPELAEVLDHNLAILSDPAQERSLTDAVVGWSFRLLTAAERTLFARLSVFGGSFSREAATAVCGDGLGALEVLDALSSLVAKSLVVRTDDADGQARFRLLQVVRAYAAARLAESGEEAATLSRHAHHQLHLVERAAPELTGHDQARWLGVLDREVTDIRAAVGWLTAAEPELAQRMVGASWRWCYLRGRYAEGRAWAEGALAAAPASPPGIRAPALAGAGMLAFLECDYGLAAVRIEECRALYGQLGDGEGVAWCLARLGTIARERGEYDRAEALHRQALELFEALGNAHETGAQLNYLAFVGWLRGDLDEADRDSQRALALMSSVGDREGTAWALINAGVTARYRGDLAGADLLLRQSLELSEDIAFREGVAWSLNQLGVLARLRGDYAAARTLQEDSLAEHRQLGDRWRAASVHDELAAIAAAQDDLTEAAAGLAAADRLRLEIGAPVPAAERPARERTVEICRRGMGETFRAASLAGLIQRARLSPAG